MFLVYVKMFSPFFFFFSLAPPLFVCVLRLFRALSTSRCKVNRSAVQLCGYLIDARWDWRTLWSAVKSNQQGGFKVWREKPDELSTVLQPLDSNKQKAAMMIGKHTMQGKRNVRVFGIPGGGKAGRNAEISKAGLCDRRSRVKTVHSGKKWRNSSVGVVQRIAKSMRARS